MYDKELVGIILRQIDEALEKIEDRSSRYDSPNAFTESSAGMETLDSICMQFMAIGESLKKVDKLTDGKITFKLSRNGLERGYGFQRCNCPTNILILMQNRCFGSAKMELGQCGRISQIF